MNINHQTNNSTRKSSVINLGLLEIISQTELWIKGIQNSWYKNPRETQGAFASVIFHCMSLSDKQVTFLTQLLPKVRTDYVGVKDIFV